MKIFKNITFAAVCLTIFAASATAQSTIYPASGDSTMKTTKSAMPLNIVIYSTEFDVPTRGENSSLTGKNIFRNALILTTRTFGSKLAQFERSGEVTNVNKHFLTARDGAIGTISGGRVIPISKSDAANSDRPIEFLNAGYVLKAAPIVVRAETNPPETSVSVSLDLDIADNEVDSPLKLEDGIPRITRREIKAKEFFYPGTTRIFGGFLSKDGSTRRYIAVSVEIVDYSSQRQ